MSLVRIIKGSEVTFRRTSGKRYVVPPIPEKVETPEDPDSDGFRRALEKLFTDENPAMLDSDNDMLTDLIDGLWAGGNPTDDDKRNDVISTAISFIDIVNDEWSKK